MTAKEFLEILDRQQLISRNVARQLHQKVDEGSNRITAESILKFLVKKDLISRDEAKRLIASRLEVTPKAQSSIMGDAALPKSPPKPKQPATKSPPPEEDLGLAPIEEDEQRSSVSRDQRAVDDEEDVEVVPVEPAKTEPSDLPDAGEEQTPKLKSQSRPAAPLTEEPLDPLGEAAARSGAFAVRKGKSSRSEKKPSRRRRVSNEWDSPLLLLGGGGLIILALAGALLYYFLFRENADQKLQVASDLFAGGSYSQAAGAYEDFVERFPNHSDISEARVRLGMARLFAAVNGKPPLEALETANEVIDSIEDEPAFAVDEDGDDGLSTAKRELSELLTTIVVRLAEEADQSEQADAIAARVSAAREAIALTNNTKYVPRRLRLDDQISGARATLELVERRLARDSDLESTLAAMDQAIADADMAKAFELREQLLAEHPMLAADSSLAAKVQEASQSEKANVRFVADSRAAVTEPRDGAAAASLALAEQSGGVAAGVTGRFTVRMDGVAYGFSAADGELLWRRYVGRAADSYPSTTPSGKVLVSDAASGDLLCLDEADGSLRWRQPLGAPTSQPVLAGDSILAASEAGRLFVLDAGSGQLAGEVQFSQPIRLPPVVGQGGRRIYVVGDHSNLYTLDAADFSCLGVLYLGHMRGAIATPPVLAAGQLIVAVNRGAETCNVQSISIDDDGILDSVDSSGRIRGLVRTPMLTTGRRVAVLSTLGAVNIYEMGGQADDGELALLASRDTRRSQHLASFGLLTDGRRESNLWLASRGLEKLAILPTGNRMPVRGIEADYAGDVFDYPLQRVDGLLIHVRRVQGQAGLAVGSLEIESGRPVWETTFAAPSAGSPAAASSDDDISLLNSAGRAYAVDGGAWSRGVLSTSAAAEAREDRGIVFSTQTRLGNGSIAAGAIGADRLSLFSVAPGSRRLRETSISLPGPLACPPVAWRQGVAVPTTVGQVVFLGVLGETLAAPFQPPLRRGETVRWQRPAVINSTNPPSLAIGEGSAVYVLNIENGARPFLAASSQTTLNGAQLSSRLALAGNQLFAAVEQGGLCRLSLPNLEQGEPIELGEPIEWGPFAAADSVLVGTVSGDMALVDATGQVRWRESFQHGWPSGEPLIEGDMAYVLYPQYGIHRFSLADGGASPPIAVGEPAMFGPTQWNQRLLLTAVDGSLLAIEHP